MEMVSKVAWLMVMLCMVVIAPHAEAITCGQVAGSLAPCIGYLRNGGPVTPNCCGGVRAINSAAKTTPDRQTTCRCLLSASKSIGINFSYASKLPRLCGVSIPYNISPSTDCSKIK